MDCDTEKEQTLDELLSELLTNLDEDNVTGAGEVVDTPFAFKATGKKGERKAKKSPYQQEGYRRASAAGKPVGNYKAILNVYDNEIQHFRNSFNLHGDDKKILDAFMVMRMYLKASASIIATLDYPTRYLKPIFGWIASPENSLEYISKKLPKRITSALTSFMQDNTVETLGVLRTHVAAMLAGYAKYLTTKIVQLNDLVAPTLNKLYEIAVNEASDSPKDLKALRIVMRKASSERGPTYNMFVNPSKIEGMFKFFESGWLQDEEMQIIITNPNSQASDIKSANEFLNPLGWKMVSSDGRKVVVKKM